MVKIANKNLKASTLIELITASIIFLVVFIASFSVLSRLIPTNDDASELIDADYRARLAFIEFSDGKQEEGEYIIEYAWGQIKVNVKEYSSYPDLQQLLITITLNKSKRNITYRYVIERV